MISNQEKNLYEDLKESNINLLNAPKQEKKIPILIPEPLNLNDYSSENEDEDEFKNLSYIKSEESEFNINLLSSWSTKASDDEMGSNNNNNTNNCKNNYQKKVTILDLLKQYN